MYDYDELKVAVSMSDMDSKYRIELIDLLEGLADMEEELPCVGDVIKIESDGSTFLVMAEIRGYYLLFRYLSKSFLLFTREEMSTCYEKIITKVDPKSIIKGVI